MNSHFEKGSVFVNQKYEKGSVSVNQRYEKKKSTFSWKIVFSSVLVVVGIAFAIIFAYASGYLGNPFKLARNAETSDLLPDSDSKEFNEKSEENLLPDPNSKELNEKSEERFVVVKNDKELNSVSTENSPSAEHESRIGYLNFSTEKFVPSLKNSKKFEKKSEERFFFVEND